MSRRPVGMPATVTELRPVPATRQELPLSNIVMSGTLTTPTAWGKPITAWESSLRAAGRSPNTIVTRSDHLRRLARAMGGMPWDVTNEQLTNWAGSQVWAQDTRRSVYASIRSFYRWAVGTGRCDESPAEDLPSVSAKAPMPRPAPEKVYRVSLGKADNRARLILRLAAEVGLRRAEIAVLHADDLIEDLDGMSLLVHGKGNRKRVVPLPTPLGLELRRRLAGGGYAFPGRMNGHLSPRFVGKIATRLLPEIWTLHTLRHRFASVAYAAERDLISVQTLLGHASVATTQRYVKAPDDALRRAVRAASE